MVEFIVSQYNYINKKPPFNAKSATQQQFTSKSPIVLIWMRKACYCFTIGAQTGSRFYIGLKIDMRSHINDFPIADFNDIMSSEFSTKGNPKLIDQLFPVEAIELIEFNDWAKAYHNRLNEILCSMSVSRTTATSKAATTK